jgi:hypothetical protein
VSERFELEYPDGRLQSVTIADSVQHLHDRTDPLPTGNHDGWTAVITTVDGEPIDLGARAFGPVEGDSSMWPIRGADGPVRKFLLDQVSSMPDAAVVRGSGAPLA